MALVAPALLSADFARLGEALGIIKAAGASMVHVDVMDAHLGVDDLFVPRSAQKVSSCSQIRADGRLDFALQVEGGIGFDNIEELIQAGADILVAGSAIFDSGNPKDRLAQMIRVAS